MPRYETAYDRLFEAIEFVSLVVFALEYLLRTWAAPKHAAYRDLKPLQARLRYAMSTDGLIDLVSVLPFWLAFVVPSELRIILLFRIVRFLKLARYSPDALDRVWKCRLVDQPLVRLEPWHMGISEQSDAGRLERRCNLGAADHVADGLARQAIHQVDVGVGDTGRPQGSNRLLHLLER